MKMNANHDHHIHITSSGFYGNTIVIRKCRIHLHYYCRVYHVVCDIAEDGLLLSLVLVEQLCNDE